MGGRTFIALELRLCESSGCSVRVLGLRTFVFAFTLTICTADCTSEDYPIPAFYLPVRSGLCLALAFLASTFVYLAASSIMRSSDFIKVLLKDLLPLE